MTVTFVPHQSLALLAAAHELAARGFRVIPVNQHKRPLVKEWPQVASSDPERIADLWARAPYANPAYTLPGLLGIDVDTAGDHKNDGRPEWVELVTRHGIPDSWTVMSPTGSWHVVFELPPRVPGLTGSAPPPPPITSGANKLAPGIDVKTGPGAFLVGPGSWTMRGVYVLVRDTAPAPAPSWLLTMLLPKPSLFPPPIPTGPSVTGSAYVAAALRAECTSVRVAGTGERNDLLNTAAFKLARFVVDGRLDEDTLIADLVEAAVVAGLPIAETMRTIRSALAARERDS